MPKTSYLNSPAALDAREALKHYTSEQLLKIQKECATLQGKARIQGELIRRRTAAARAERDRARRAR